MRSTPFNPFGVGYIDHPDYNEADHQQEFERWMVREDAIDGLLDGTVQPDYVLGLLESQDIDPIVYVQSVEEAIRYALEHPELELSIEYE